MQMLINVQKEHSTIFCTFDDRINVQFKICMRNVLLAVVKIRFAHQRFSNI